MANYLKLAFDRQSQTLAPLTGFAPRLPTLFQYDLKDLIIQVVDPTSGLVNGGSATYSFPDFTGTNLRVTLSDTPIGNGAATVLAQNTNLVLNAANAAITGNTGQFFSGSLDLTQAALATYIGTLASKQAYLEVAVREGGVTKPVFLEQITVKAVGDTGATTPSPAPNLYMTVAEAKAMFLQKAGTRADQKVFLSADLSKAVLLYLDNDGTLRNDPITPVPAPAD